MSLPPPPALPQPKPSVPQGQKADNQPIRSRSIHANTDRMLALIESEVVAHTTAAAQKAAELRAELADARHRETALQAAVEAAHAENGALRARLGIMAEDSRRLIGMLGALGVTVPTRTGASAGAGGERPTYGAEWRALFEALKDEGSRESDAEDDDGGEDSEMLDQKPMGDEGANPMRDLARVRLLLERRRTKCERWKQKFHELERTSEDEKKVLCARIEALQQHTPP